MNVIELLDDTFRKLGTPENVIDKLRQEAIQKVLPSKNDRWRMERELSEEEITKYRNIIMIFLLSFILSPEEREKAEKEMDDLLELN